MKITVRAHPNSKIEKIEKEDTFYYEVFFNVSPEAGKANKKLTEMLAVYFRVPKTRVQIRAGEKSRVKIVEIIDLSFPKED